MEDLRTDGGSGALRIAGTRVTDVTSGSPSRTQRVAFAEAAVQLADAPEHSEDARRWSRVAATALVRLGLADDGGALSTLLRPHPDDTAVTWTVACYQIGDLTPTELRDFSEPVAAVTMLASCPEASHVAAELLASNDGGLRWSALVRTREVIIFRFPSEDSCGESVDTDLLDAAVDGWDDRLSRWAARPEETAAPGAAPAAKAGAAGDAIVELLETVRAIDRRLDGTGSDQLAGMAGRLERLETMAAETVALAERIGAIEALFTANAEVADRLGRIEQQTRDHDQGVTARLDTQHAETQLLTARLDAQHTDLRSAGERIDGIEIRLAAAGKAAGRRTREVHADQAAIAGRVERLEATAAALEALPAELTERVRRIEERIQVHSDTVTARLEALEARAERPLGEQLRPLVDAAGQAARRAVARASARLGRAGGPR